MEFVSPEGLRIDGRRPRELRRISCQLDVLTNADGSAIFEMGNTKVRKYAITGGHTRRKHPKSCPLSLPTHTHTSLHQLPGAQPVCRVPPLQPIQQPMQGNWFPCPDRDQLNCIPQVTSRVTA